MISGSTKLKTSEELEKFPHSHSAFSVSEKDSDKAFLGVLRISDEALCLGSDAYAYFLGSSSYHPLEVRGKAYFVDQNKQTKPWRSTATI